MEIELKWGLRRPEDMDRLLAELPEASMVLHQRNHYFTDCEGELSKAKTMVRFREQGSDDMNAGQVILTVKRRVAKEAGVFRAEESEEEVDTSVWEEILSGRRNLDELESPALQGLRRSGISGAWRSQGCLVNKRHVVPLEGFVLEIDQTTFDDGHIDVEVEVETEDIEGAKRLLTRIGKEYGIVFFDQTYGKYSRFLSRTLGF